MTGATVMSPPTQETQLRPSIVPTSLLGAMDADEMVSRAVLRLAISVATTVVLIGLTVWGAVAFAEKWRASADHSTAMKFYRQALSSASSGDLPTAITQYGDAMSSVGAGDVLYNLCQRGTSDCYTAEGSHDQATGDNDDAEESYDSALKADPTNAVAHFDEATLYQSRGEQIDALTQYSLAYQDDPFSIAGVTARQQAEQGYLALGEQDFSNGNLSRARDNWQHVIDLDRNSSYADQARQRMSQVEQ